MAIVLAGHNGSGKSTLWERSLSDKLQMPLVNADRMMMSILPKPGEDGHLTPWASSAAADYGQPTASVSRWRVSALPATREAVPGLLGRPRWLVEMMRCRGAEAAEWELEACDETGRLALPAELADRSLAQGAGRQRAAG